MWMPQVNAVLAALVVTIGFWIAWGELPVLAAVSLALCVAGALFTFCSTSGRIWAVATFLVGLESLAWPVVTMVQIRDVTTNPSDEQMTQILTSVVSGLFSSIFWLTFSWGIYRRTARGQHGGTPTSGPPVQGTQADPRADTRRPR
jgi:hypothetical protein